MKITKSTLPAYVCALINNPTIPASDVAVITTNTVIDIVPMLRFNSHDCDDVSWHKAPEYAPPVNSNLQKKRIKKSKRKLKSKLKTKSKKINKRTYSK